MFIRIDVKLDGFSKFVNWISTRRYSRTLTFISNLDYVSQLETENLVDRFSNDFFIKIT